MYENEQVASNRIPVNSAIVTGQTLQVARRRCSAKSCLDVVKKTLGRDQRFSAVVLSQIDLGNAET